MASVATQPQADDATGRALKEGYVVVIPGTRGRNSSIVADKAYAKMHKDVKKGQIIYTGRAPKLLSVICVILTRKCRATPSV